MKTGHSKWGTRGLSVAGKSFTTEETENTEAFIFFQSKTRAHRLAAVEDPSVFSKGEAKG